MAWTTPKTDWATGNLVAASNLNDIGNDLAYLKSPPTASYKANEASDYTTTSTTFTNVDATNFALTITTAGGDVLVFFSGSVKHSAGGQGVFFDVEVDGARWGSDDGIIVVTEPTAGYAVNASFVRTVRGLSAGSHTFKLQWKVSSGTATMWAGAGTASGDIHPEFGVREVS